jgi:hypothetical protein
LDHDFPGCCAVRDNELEGSNDDSWSMEVNIENEDLGSKIGTWFQMFVDCAVAKLDTGQKLRFCVAISVRVLRTLGGLCRDTVRVQIEFLLLIIAMLVG